MGHGQLGRPAADLPASLAALSGKGLRAWDGGPFAEENKEVWVDPVLTDADKLGKQSNPYPLDRMESYEVSRRVNSPANEGRSWLARKFHEDRQKLMIK